MDEPQNLDVQPYPVPTSFTTGSVDADDGSTWVVLQIQTPAGVGMYFLSPEAAVQVGNALRAEGKKGIGPRLVTPTNSLVVPGR